MPLNVKSDDAHRLARELAGLTGTSITEAVTIALKEAVDRARALRSESSDRLVSDLAEIAIHCASLPVLDARSAEEILGYDERGLPA
jgi:antitoxin VapB